MWAGVVKRVDLAEHARGQERQTQAICDDDANQQGHVNGQGMGGSQRQEQAGSQDHFVHHCFAPLRLGCLMGGDRWIGVMHADATLGM
jgi:hypothetical protein